MPTRAIVFDFNGTLSDDEPLLYAVYAELFAEQGRPLTERQYLDELAGQTEEEIIRRWLGRVDDELIRERIDRYIARASDGSTVDEDARAAVRLAAEHMPVGVVSAAARREIEPVLAASGVAEHVAALVSADDVTNGKPDPEPYERMAAILGIEAGEMVVFEDTEAGVASAKTAGARVVALTRTLDAARLRAADDFVPRLDADAVRRCL
jgi:HAD superfamily hydrolase (TIGR01509 family)